MKTTTLHQLWRYNACEGGMETLCRGLGKRSANPAEDHEPLSYLKIHEINGDDDFLWSLRTLPREEARKLCDKLEALKPGITAYYQDLCNLGRVSYLCHKFTKELYKLVVDTCLDFVKD